MSDNKQHPGVSEALAVVLAWLVPGLGHIYLGRRIRGLIILLTMAATFWAGIAIGGVMTVDYRTERWWFAADMATGMYGLISWQRSEKVNQDVDKKLVASEDFKNSTRDVTDAISRLQDAKGDDAKRLELARAEFEQKRNLYAAAVLASEGLVLVAPADTVARAFCGIAGFLNLMCIFDVFMLARMGVRGEEKIEPPTQQVVQ